MFFVSLTALLGAFIAASRQSAAGSAAEALGGLWCESVLAEYDLPLQERYRIFGFYGSCRETPMRLDFYAERDFRGKKYINYEGSRVYLDEFSLGSSERMKDQMVRTGKLIAAKKLILPEQDVERRTNGSEENKGKGHGSKGKAVTVPSHPSAERTGKIADQAVLAALPSSGASGGWQKEKIIAAVKGLTSLKSAVKKGTDQYFLGQYLFVLFRDHIHDKGLDACCFDNEIEYVICGYPDDQKNLAGVKHRIVAVREALNLMFVLEDPEMNEKTLAMAEALTPGPAAAATQKLLQAGWALAESYNDYQLLIQGKKVPLKKDHRSWAVDLESVLASGKSKRKKGGKKDSEKGGEVVLKKEVPCVDPGNSRGETYEDYLRFFVSLTGEELQLLRMMDLMQINMQYGWYEDFLLRDHYSGIEAVFKVNGKDYTSRREYFPEKMSSEHE
ncbi:MAG: DUF5702 domain-containing protein [Eubacterium sp.]